MIRLYSHDRSGRTSLPASLLSICFVRLESRLYESLWGTVAHPIPWGDSRY
jgi:hypothetical protein